MKCLAIPSCIALTTTLLLTACNSIPNQTRYTGHVIEGNADMVSACKFLDNLSGSSGLTGFFALKGADNIKQNLLKHADAMGATHVVWDKPNVDYESTTLTGKAYLCPTVSHP